MWLHFWSVARYDLKLTAEEFYDLTPKQFHSLCRRHRSNLEGPEYMLAQIVAAVYNTGYRLKDQVTPLAFMPSQAGKNKSKTAESNAPVRMGKRRRKQLATSVNAILMAMTSAASK